MRYLPQTADARQKMLDVIGVKTIDELFCDIPKGAFIDGMADLPAHKGEIEVEREMAAMAGKNMDASSVPFFLGGGVYNHHIPASVDYIIQRSEFLTAYTPYQPEIAQGTLQAIFEYQTYIARLTGQDVANASLYDGSTACAEAALMAMRITKRKKVAIGSALNPEYRKVLETYLHNLDDREIMEGEPDNETACLIVQSPDFFGNIHKYDKYRKLCDEAGALLIVVITEVVSLGLLPVPAMADIVCGDGQSISVPMSFGGPHLGFFACKEKYIRQMPGRLCGMTEDADGRRGFVLTLSTREQHIRRDKATSNICTNQGLCALSFAAHMSLLGETGFKTLARLNHEAACKLADSLEKVKGVRVVNEAFFNEFVVELPDGTDASIVLEDLVTCGIIGGLALDEGRLLVTATELTTDNDIKIFAETLAEVLK
ncbi:MAG: aminomethyl-transferring glycine dehydrogenase subunit GcvPA [Alphaproteobacteria bacterium]|nr:aminomethyl-transferring glycine dehydrogenase subunit GcvPA [Alphaproteobacteria bacterium]